MISRKHLKELGYKNMKLLYHDVVHVSPDAGEVILMMSKPQRVAFKDWCNKKFTGDPEEKPDDPYVICIETINKLLKR